jgi:hypothetical protein
MVSAAALAERTAAASGVIMKTAHRNNEPARVVIDFSPN